MIFLKKTIAYCGGDGVGPEVVQEGLKILKTISEYSDFEFEYKEVPGGGAAYKQFGASLPKKSFETIRNSDAFLFGAAGLPDLPPGTAELIVLLIRQRLDLYVNLRPIKLYESLRDRCPLKDDFIGKGINITFVRENTEGLYANKGSVLKDDVAENLMVVTRKGCERIINYAFEYAKQSGHSKVTSVDKANVLSPSRLWRKIFHEIGNKYPDIEKEDIFIDAFCQFLIRKPDSFQTVVTGNMFGDIISDEGAFLIGSLGMASSGNIHPGKVSMYEPIHGSAPDIGGKGIANPIGAILSVKLMMEESFQALEIGRDIENSVEEALKKGRTVDIENPQIKTLTTKEFGDLIAEELKVNLTR
ncbi:MAG: isocitrate/isopropylmalate dehydrogenase family protein [Promethearchaeota archaeon]